jgi:hypothetical protein
MSTKKTIKSAFESMLFVWGEPLPAKTAAEVFDIPWQEAYGYFKELLIFMLLCMASLLCLPYYDFFILA